MFYKMAFIDLDGTLLSFFDRISSLNLKSLKKYKYLGGEIVLCTGRWPISAYKINTILENYNGESNKYLICLNGALIYDLKTKKTINKKFIDTTISTKIFNVMKDLWIRSFIYSEFGVKNRIIHSFRTPFKKILGYFNSGVKITNFDSFDNDNLTIYKILFFSISTKKISRACEVLKNTFANEIQISKTSKHSIEITALNVSKGHALKLVSKLSKIPKSQIATFGDSGNDISMFNESGIGFAIKTKNKNLLKISKYLIKEKNGVSVGIEKFLLNNILNFQKAQRNLILDISYFNLDILNNNVDKYKNIFKFSLLNGNFIFITSEPAIEIMHSLNNFTADSKLIFCNNSCSLYSIKEKKYLLSKFFSDTRMNTVLNILKKEMEYNTQAVFIFYVTQHTHYVVANTFMDYELFLQNNNLNREIYEFIKLDELLSRHITSICQVRIFNYKYNISTTRDLIVRTHKDFIDINPSVGFSKNQKDILNIMEFDGKIISMFNQTKKPIKKTTKKEKENEIFFLKKLDKEIGENILV